MTGAGTTVEVKSQFGLRREGDVLTTAETFEVLDADIARIPRSMTQMLDDVPLPNTNSRGALGRALLAVVVFADSVFSAFLLPPVFVPLFFCWLTVCSRAHIFCLRFVGSVKCV